MSEEPVSGGQGNGDDGVRDADEGAPTRRLPTLEKQAPPPPGGPAGPGDSREAPGDAAEQRSAGGRAHRFWADRRAPAAVVSLLLLAGFGVLLYDVASVRAGRPVMAWRRVLADELATRRVDDVYVLAGAALLAALGLWLLVFALTPGLRGLLPMRRETPHVRAGLERDAAGLVLRDRAMEVAGVRTVRVKVGRRKVKARAQAHFRDLEEVRGDLGAALDEGVRQLGLARRPGLSVHVRRPKKR